MQFIKFTDITTETIKKIYGKTLIVTTHLQMCSENGVCTLMRNSKCMNYASRVKKINIFLNNGSSAIEKNREVDTLFLQLNKYYLKSDE